jgi:transcriptional regulator with XRE-family HTH domain
MADRPKNHPVDPRIGDRIRMRRLMLDMSQSHLAEGLSVSFQQIQKYEKGANDVSVGKLAEIAAFMDVPAAYFFAESAVPWEAPESAADVARRSIVSSCLSKKECVRLVLAFDRITEPQMRQNIVQLVQTIAARSDRVVVD